MSQPGLALDRFEDSTNSSCSSLVPDFRRHDHVIIPVLMLCAGVDTPNLSYFQHTVLGLYREVLVALGCTVVSVHRAQELPQLLMPG